MTIPLAIAAGMFAARRRNTIADRSIVTLGLASSSIPEFVSGVTLQYLIGVKLGWFPVLALAPPGSGFLTQLNYLMLPALALVVVYFGYIARMTRAGTIQALDADYTRTAVMKGLGNRQVMRRHVMRNALQPTVSVIGDADRLPVQRPDRARADLQLPRARQPDLQRRRRRRTSRCSSAAVILVGIIYMLCTLVADLVIAWMNPRARLGRPERASVDDAWTCRLPGAVVGRPAFVEPTSRPRQRRSRSSARTVDAGAEAAARHPRRASARPAGSACRLLLRRPGFIIGSRHPAVLDRVRHRRRPDHAVRPAHTTSTSRATPPERRPPRWAPTSSAATCSRG